MSLKICERCGIGFTCMNDTDEPCWCNNLTLTNKTHKHLLKNYKNCLCPSCLAVFSEKKEKTVE